VLRYALDGDVSRLLIPADSTLRRGDRLWQHTCFEAFVMAGGLPGYCEINFSPSAEWAIYSFSGYRDGMTALEVTRAPEISVHREPGRLNLEAAVDLELWRRPQVDGGLRLALSAVIEETDGRLSYWALAHPAAKPDFHHAGAFVLSLPQHDSRPPRGTERG
jgi:hypothetical protein